MSSRLVRAVVLAAWSVFLFFLWLSGEMSRFLGPRTYWVVAFGAITLGFAAVAHLVTLRTGSDLRVSRGDLIGAGVLLVPLVVLAAIPQPNLGALAASRKATGVGAAALAPPIPEEGEELSFIEVHFANESDEYGAKLGIVEGIKMNLVGFVSEGATNTGTFELTRFYISCCAADAIPYSVTIDPGANEPEHSPDSWLQVSGALHESEGNWVLVADDVKHVKEPRDPYLY